MMRLSGSTLVEKKRQLWRLVVVNFCSSSVALTIEILDAVFVDECNEWCEPNSSMSCVCDVECVFSFRNHPFSVCGYFLCIRFVGHPVANATLALMSRIFTLFVPLWTLLFIVYHWPAQGASNPDSETAPSSSSSYSSSSASSSSFASSSSSSATDAFAYTLSSNANDEASRSYTRAQRDGDDDEEEDGSVYVTNIITSPTKVRVIYEVGNNLKTRRI